MLRATSTGLACGNTRGEALLHALCGVVERDVLYRDGQSGGQARTLIDPATVDDPYGQEVIARLAAAGMAVELSLVDGLYGLPVCVAYLWSEDFPVIFAGGGCHTSPAIAATRALTEAARSRLTAIAGTRDDLPSDPASFDVPPFRPARATGLIPWPQATARFDRTPSGFTAQVQDVARRVAHATGHEPVVLDLSDGSASIHAVQVVCPGARSRIRRAMPPMTHPTTTSTPAVQLADQFDGLYAARARSTLAARLYATAMGDNSKEVAASSSCDWPLLGLLAARLRMQPGQVLVDAGCGTGGVGLWLARALAACLHGFDVSTVAVAQATDRSSRFIPVDRAAFRVATLNDTGLPDHSAHGAVCVDAFGLTADRSAATHELGRIMAPDARLTLTRSLRQGAAPVWEEQASAAGLVVEHVDERPAEPAMWTRLYRLWIDHADELRRELGDDQAQNMLREAHRMLPALPGRRAVLLPLRRPRQNRRPPRQPIR
ncbi:YcaO-like family protein [Streptomyces sp. NPDC014676]|uniref:YcaO-like family protein n=1 Tax=Streptomyces sp. NPDC014676 TaxID=3364879 RepID=UPI0037026541